MKKLILSAVFLLFCLSFLSGCNPMQDYTAAVLESSLLQDLQAVEDNLSAMDQSLPEVQKNDFPSLRALLAENEAIFGRIEPLLSALEPEADVAQQAHHRLVTAFSVRREVNQALAVLLDGLEAIEDGGADPEQKEALQSLPNLISDKNAKYAEEIQAWQRALNLE